MATRRLSDYLRRFRPAATPGGAAPAGVPSDVVAGLEVELAPVFAALEDAHREADAVREEARAAALRIAEAASVEVGSIEARARREAAAARAAVSAERARLAGEELERMLAAAREEATSIEARAAQRMPDMVARVVDLVLEVERPSVAASPIVDPSERVR